MRKILTSGQASQAEKYARRVCGPPAGVSFILAGGLFLFMILGLPAQTTLSVEFADGGVPATGFSIWDVSMVGSGSGVDLIGTNFGPLFFTLSAATAASASAPPAVAGDGTLADWGNGVISRNRGAIASSGGFTEAGLYADFVTPDAGGALGFQISGLSSNAAYAVTFYSFDENHTRTNVFVDYTSGGDSLLGEIIYNNGSPTVTQGSGDPTANGQYALTATVTSDASGRLTFGETTTVPGAGPVFNGFTITAITNVTPGVVVWEGTINGNWDISTTANWQTNADYVESMGMGPAVVFDDTASGSNTAIILNATVSPASVLVSNSVLTYSISGAGGIAGGGSLTKAGSGPLTLGTANTYTGGTVVAAGTLILTATNNVSMAYTIGGTLATVATWPALSLAMDSLIFSNGSPQLTFDLQPQAGMCMAQINDSGALVMDGDVTVNVLNPTSANRVLLQYNGRSGPGIFLAGALPAGAGILDDTTNQRVLYVADTNVSSPRQIIKVYLQAGQSNADGRALTNGLPPNLVSPQPDVCIYYGDTGNFTDLRPLLSTTANSFGPELTFGRTLADFFGRTNHVATNQVMVAILKYSVGGTSLYSDWKAGGDATFAGDGPRYVAFQNSVSAGFADLAAAFTNAILELDGMIWVQGETDIDLSSGATGLSPNPAIAAAYGTNLMRFINDVRLTYASQLPYGTNLPFFLSRISTNQTAFSNPANAAYPYYLEVRAGQASAAASLPNTFMLDTDGSQFSVGTIGAETAGNQHFDTGGQQTLGAAFAQTVIGALAKPRIQSVLKAGQGWSVTFAGGSGINYLLERAAALTGPWSVVAGVFMGASGMTNSDDPCPPATNAYYRISYP